MAKRNLRRILRLVAVAVAALVLGTSPIWGAHLGRRVDWLIVRRIEISGTRLLAPHEVLAASGIREGQHLLDESELWEQALRAHPVIADARVERRPPHTLRIRVSEKSPVALVSDGTLRFATGSGEVLPVDPFVVPLDLPVIHGSFGDSISADALRKVLTETERLGTAAPWLLTDVSEIRAHDRGGDELLLIHRVADLVLPRGAGGPRLEELRRVIADVERRFPSDAEARPRPRHRIDLRFADQVVVRPFTPREPR